MYVIMIVAIPYRSVLHTNHTELAEVLVAVGIRIIEPPVDYYAKLRGFPFENFSVGHLTINNSRCPSSDRWGDNDSFVRFTGIALNIDNFLQRIFASFNPNFAAQINRRGLSEIRIEDVPRETTIGAFSYHPIRVILRRRLDPNVWALVGNELAFGYVDLFIGLYASETSILLRLFRLPPEDARLILGFFQLAVKNEHSKKADYQSGENQEEGSSSPKQGLNLERLEFIIFKNSYRYFFAFIELFFGLFSANISADLAFGIRRNGWWYGRFLNWLDRRYGFDSFGRVYVTLGFFFVAIGFFCHGIITIFMPRIVL
jgi:hypothetical protein